MTIFIKIIKKRYLSLSIYINTDTHCVCFIHNIFSPSLSSNFSSSKKIFRQIHLLRDLCRSLHTQKTPHNLTSSHLQHISLSTSLKITAELSCTRASKDLHAIIPNTTVKKKKMDPSKGRTQYSSHSPCKCLFEAMQDDHSQSPCRHRIVSKNRLKDVIHSLETSKELLKALSRIWRIEHQTSASLSLMSTLQFELDSVCVQVNKLLKEQSLERGEIDLILKQFQEEKRIWKIKEGDRIHCAIKCISGELNNERKLRQQTERLNKKLGIELAEMKASLSVASKDLESEKRGRRLLEKVCEEMARGVGEDRAVVEKIKRRSDKVRQEVEKEREMLQLADILREERVQMKLSEAKYQFEEKNAVLDELRDELEAYLQFKKTEKQEKASPTFDKIKELEVYLRETLPGFCKFQSNDQENVEEVCKEDEPANYLHSNKLDLDDMSKSFQWSCAVKNDGTKKPAICTETKWTDKSTEWEFSTNKQGDLEVFDNRGLFEFASQSWKKSVEDELERYNMIKDLRDHIVSGSRIAAASQDSDDPGQQNVASSKDTERVACEV